MATAIIFLVTTLVGMATCRYSCLCNYHVELSVMATDMKQTIGYLYEFDCKEVIPVQTPDSGWIAVAFEHQVGFVEKDAQVQLQTCPGDPPTDDLAESTTITTPKKTSTTPILTTFTAQETPTTSRSTTLSTLWTSTTSPSTNILTTPTTTEIVTTSLQTTHKVSTSKLTTKQTTPSQTKMQISTTEITTSTVKETTVPDPNTSTSTKTTTTTTTTTTTKPPTITTQHITEEMICPRMDPTVSMDSSSLITHIGKDCFEVIRHMTSWTHAEVNCRNHNGGHLAHIASAAQQKFIFALLQKLSDHSVWIGLHDRNDEGQFQWASGHSLNYTHWNPTSGHHHPEHEDCVVLVPSHQGLWNDIVCTKRHNYICQFPMLTPYVSPTSNMVTNSVSQTEGNINMCPANVRRHAAVNGDILGQHAQWCYELLPHIKYTWQHSEDICSQLGGHLVHISNVQEQLYVTNMTSVHLHDNAIWIGLNDHQAEGRFQWTSGEAVQYTNWVPGHNNINLNSFEDCGVLIPYKNGQWDDIPCGHHLNHGGEAGEAHPLMCQYRIVSPGGISLVG